MPGTAASNALSEVGLVAAREIKKNLRSAKGLVMAVLSLLGGALTALLLVKLRSLDEAKIDPEQLHKIQEELLTKKYGDPAMGHYLADAPPVLLGILVISVWLGPLLVVLLGFDALSGELQYKSVRYWTIRARRSAFYMGKWLGLWTVVMAITLFMHLIIWVITMAQSSSVLPSQALGWGLRFYAITIPIAAAWCGLAQLISSQFKTPIIALLVTCAVFGTMWLVDVIGELGDTVHWLVYLYPNTYDAWLLSPKLDVVGKGVVVCLVFAAVSTVAGAFLFQRRDL